MIGDAVGARVDGVLDQLLDDRRRPLDDFAGGNLVREIVRESGDAAHDQDCVTNATDLAPR